MAAPVYTWEFNCDLFGDRVPKIVTLEATAIETKIGTLLCMDGSGRVALATDGNGALLLGLAAENTVAQLVAGAPLKVAIIAPGMVIKGTSDADVSALSGFIGKAYDVNADGTFDGDDVAGGGLILYRTEDAGLTVYCLFGAGALIP